MNDESTGETVKDKDLKGYIQTAKLAKIFSDPMRVELLDALAQGARSVDSLARVCDLPLKSVSHHLQKLHGASLVNRVKIGRKITYSIANEAVISFLGALQKFTNDLAYASTITFENILAAQPVDGITTEHLVQLITHDDVSIIDVRPVEEYMSGHLPGAISMPGEDLSAQIKNLPQNKPVVAFCRGPYCKLADKAVDILKKAGYRAIRCADGIVEWRSKGMSIEIGSHDMHKTPNF